MADFPSPRLRLFLLAYRAAWVLLLPVVLVYLRLRARKDPLYAHHLPERFGHSQGLDGAVWIHVVSVGEVRAAAPLIRALLERGERVVLTHFTPAGRREAQALFSAPIAAGTLHSVWVPFELSGAFRRFFRLYRPAYGLVIEVEIWPVMIMEARRAGVPLFMANAIFPARSFARDRDGLRGEIMRGFAGAMVKSEVQRDRFAAVGLSNIAVTGELRFDLPPPVGQVQAGLRARAALAPAHGVLAFASIVEGEDALMIDTIKALPPDRRPLIVYVPRAPERFDAVAGLLAGAGLRVAWRSLAFDTALAPRDLPDCDVLLGDSLGEMFFYLAMADRVVVGGGFVRGSHNIIEPLSLGKPVIVGPDITTIEYPAAEAIEAGVCRQVQTGAELISALSEPVSSADTTAFLAAHAGAVARTLDALPRLLATSR
ncbi:glycosyltransferase N-terminal domain-containing protein [Limimaricola sp.]|uniref:3-deoxy-D-manno-octulosonic acid transferase n=1 Tax=Limimaricola sp. TaxID=2211665 RepID=UPI0025C4B39F|nr:glycosyltransferase N-terminal domain-containing protein [Limimaricola sp.]